MFGVSILETHSIQSNTNHGWYYMFVWKPGNNNLRFFFNEKHLQRIETYIWDYFF